MSIAPDLRSEHLEGGERVTADRFVGGFSNIVAVKIERQSWRTIVGTKKPTVASRKAERLDVWLDSAPAIGYELDGDRPVGGDTHEDVASVDPEVSYHEFMEAICSAYSPCWRMLCNIDS